MGKWLHIKGNAWNTEKSPELSRTIPHSYHMIGFQEIVYSIQSEYTPVCFNTIRITFSQGTVAKEDSYRETEASLLSESDRFFPMIELVKSPTYDNITDPCATRYMPGNSSQAVKFLSLKSEEKVKNTLDYIKAIEPDWYAEHGKKLLEDLSLHNRPSVKKMLALLKPVTEKEDSCGDRVRYRETLYEVHERLDKAMDIMKSIAEVYSADKDSLGKLISDLGKEVVQFRDLVPDSRADGLIDNLNAIRLKVIGEHQTFKRKHQETQKEDKGVQTTFLPDYASRSSVEELNKRVKKLEDDLENEMGKSLTTLEWVMEIDQKQKTNDSLKL
jgi:hypothetical protein